MAKLTFLFEIYIVNENLSQEEKKPSSMSAALQRHLFDEKKKKKCEKGSSSYFAPIMSNRVNEDRRRATVCGGVSAGRTTALWFRGWPWPWWIDQPVKPPGDCRVAMTTKAPVLPSLRLAKIPGEFRGLCLDTRIIGVAVAVFLTLTLLLLLCIWHFSCHLLPP